MRFSDMMGSGDSPPAADESDTEVAEAVAPYSDDTQPEVPAELPVFGEVPVVAEVAPAPMVPMTPIPVAVGPVAEDPIAISLTDFTPLSDDLLPRRR